MSYSTNKYSTNIHSTNIQSTNKQIMGSYFGIFDDSYNETIKVRTQIPWTYFDRIYIAFATLDEYGNLTDTDLYSEDKIYNITNWYRKAVPHGKIFISSNYGDIIDQWYLVASKNPDNFARSVLSYLIKYNLDGYDMDWESPFINDYSQQLISLLTACKKQFGNKYFLTHTVLPDVHSPQLIGNLSNIVDGINIMSYGYYGISLETLINDYHEKGFPYEKMLIGVDSEDGIDNEVSIQNKTNIIRKYNLGGIYLWRLDNDSRYNNHILGPPTFYTANLTYNIFNNYTT